MKDINRIKRYMARADVWRGIADTTFDDKRRERAVRLTQRWERAASVASERAASVASDRVKSQAA